MAMTERQEKWFASVRASLQAETGRSMAEWVEIAKTCPETAHRAKLKWFKEVHGLGQNRASIILGEAGPGLAHWAESDSSLDALWTDPASRAIHDAVAAKAEALPGLVTSPRKSFVGFSRAFQFAAIRPLKGGGALLGLDVEPEADPRLEPVKRESWSARLKSTLRLTSPTEVDENVAGLLRKAWERAS